jgi:ABC-type bacteriocin/lantibiotic exporter with double-glycine peptidase domain
MPHADALNHADSAENASLPEAAWQVAASAMAHDDPLLACLLALARLHERAMSAAAVLAGLPLVDGRLTPELFVRAAHRFGLDAALSRCRAGRWMRSAPACCPWCCCSTAAMPAC